MIRKITHECKKTLGEILKIKLNKMTEITGIKKILLSCDFKALWDLNWATRFVFPPP